MLTPEQMSKKICPFTLQRDDNPQSCILHRCMAFQERNIAGSIRTQVQDCGCSNFNPLKMFG